MPSIGRGEEGRGDIDALYLLQVGEDGLAGLQELVVGGVVDSHVGLALMGGDHDALLVDNDGGVSAGLGGCHEPCQRCA